MPGRLVKALGIGVLAVLGTVFVLWALILGLSDLIGPVAALALCGVLCLSVAALTLGLQRKAPNPAAELGMLLGILVLRSLLRR